MAETATSDLICAGLKTLQREVQADARRIAANVRLDAIQQDVHNLQTASARQDERLDCIERRLDLAAAH